MINKINDYLYVIKIRLEGSPLRDLNCYVIQSPDRNLLIDTGFNTPECFRELQMGIGELGLDMSKTDILATHFHADHCGLIGKIAEPECQVYMGEIDVSLMKSHLKSDEYWQTSKALYQQEGFSVDALANAIENNPAKALVNDKPVDVTPLKDGQILTVGNIKLKCIHTPGHTPGQICLYNEEDKFMVLGDHVLFDITPNITTWPTLKNSLGSYMESLHMIKKYDVVLPLPGHRECDRTLAERVDQLLVHHERRLSETLQIVRENPGINGYDVAGHMHWSIRVKNWSEFPLTQKWFAVGETLAHLYYLMENGKIHREIRDGLAAYACQ